MKEKFLVAGFGDFEIEYENDLLDVKYKRESVKNIIGAYIEIFPGDWALDTPVLTLKIRANRQEEK